MKKFLLILIFFALAAGVVSAQQLELKDVIVRSARGIEGELPQKAKVAVLNFNSPTRAFSDYVIEELINELLEAGKVTIVDRQNLTAIMNEMKFQYSGYVSDESMVSIGKMIGAQYIISGALTNKETYYTFRIRIISVETATIQRQITSDLKNDNQVARLLGGTSAPTSNVKNNWVSAEVLSGYTLGNWSEAFGLSVGARYERMLSPYVSLGVDFYSFIPISSIDGSRADRYNIDIDAGSPFGIDASIRFYPTGKKFFFGIALGYYDHGNIVKDTDSTWNMSAQKMVYDKYIIGHETGFAVTGEFGWKIDVGKEGGFFVEPGFLGTFMVGSYDDDTSHYPDYPDWKKDVNDGGSIRGYWRLYLGVGWAF